MITGIRNGQIVIAYINGKQYRREFDSKDDAIAAYKQLIETKKTPHDANLIALEALFSPSTIIEHNKYINYNREENKFYLYGTEIEMPSEIVEVFDDYLESGESVESIMNFWRLLSENPVDSVRKDLFNFLMQYDFAITDKGYITTYKVVKNVEDVTQTTYALVLQKLLYNRPVNKLTEVNVYRELDTGELHFVDGPNENLDVETNAIEFLGDIQHILDNPEDYSKDGSMLFTDFHTGSMDIRLGTPVREKREDCNDNPSVECGKGLHVGATKYVNWFQRSMVKNGLGSVLICLVNPAKVLSVPKADKSKIRCTEYFPLGIAKWSEEQGVIPLEERYFEGQYVDFETSIEEDQMDEVDKAVAKVHESTIEEIEV